MKGLLPVGRLLAHASRASRAGRSLRPSIGLETLEDRRLLSLAMLADVCPPLTRFPGARDLCPAPAAACIQMGARDDADLGAGEAVMDGRFTAPVGGPGVDFSASLNGETPPAEPGWIQGRVWSDQNRDGVLDDREQPVPGILVQLHADSLEVIATTSSDENGRYAFSILDPGTYYLRVRPPEVFEITVSQAGARDERDSDFDPLTRTTRAIDVASGEIVSHVDAGLISTWQNPFNALDVNQDSVVGPLDALLVINYLNARGTTTPPVPPLYRDVSGDGSISPQDVLLIINHLIRSSLPGDGGIPDPGEASAAPVLVSPGPGASLEAAMVTLRFQPPDGYVGAYLVRLDDQRWDGFQATGFEHDSAGYYLSVTTQQISVTVPARAGHAYRWWVQRPGLPAAEATFSIRSTAVTSMPPPPPADQVAPAEFVGGRYRATAMARWSDQPVDVSGALQHWIDQLPAGATLELPAGRYLVSSQIVIRRRITLTSVGKFLGDPPSDESAADCAELIATPALNAPYGILMTQQLESLHHLILNGNRQGRVGTLAYQKCASGQDNRYGFNARLAADDCIIEGNVFKNALGGTGLEVAGSRSQVTIRGNLFARNGVHATRNLWADGLTVLDARDSRIEGNTFLDNTDIDLIFGGAERSVVRSNRILHTSEGTGGAFAGLMIHKWSTTSGNYAGVDISENLIDGGPNRDLGSGIYLASEGWYDQTPVGSSAAGQLARVHHNTVRNTKNGMYVAAQRFQVTANRYYNTYGTPFRTSRGTLTSPAPIVVSPRAQAIDFGGEDTHPATRSLFAYQDWRGHVPNWPF